MTESLLAKALAALQTDLPELRKGETAEVLTKSGGKYSYSYADLADCSKVIMPKLGAVGLSFSSKPTIVDGQFVLVYTLRHSAGEADQGIYPLPDPTRHSPQEIGSAITYGRRYSLCAITGLAPGGDDDDGAAASKHVASPVNPRPRKQQPPSQPRTDNRGQLWRDIAEARGLKGWTHDDVQSDFAQAHDGKKYEDASSDELRAYLETLKEAPA